MVASPDVRKAAFAAFVERALRGAHQRGLSVPKIAELAGIGSNTIYRWRDGNWIKGPGAEQVVAFCDALDIPVSAAFSILWPGKAERAQEPEPPPMDPDLQELLRRLEDPNTPAFEKEFISETLRTLAARAVSTGSPPAATPPRRQRRAS